MILYTISLSDFHFLKLIWISFIEKQELEYIFISILNKSV